MKSIKALVTSKKKEGDSYFKKGSFGFAAESYRSAIRAVESTPESKKALKAWVGVIAGMLSVCYVKQGSWKECIDFATLAVGISKKNAKAWAAKAEALENVGDIEGALEAGSTAYDLDPENHEISLLAHRCAVRIHGVEDGPKPRSSDFETVSVLGEGNYSSVVLAKSVWTGKLYALKVLSLMMVKKKEKRHKNIKNEIMMEKDVLVRLNNHPNIVKMHHTFSDAAALYYLFEYTEGVEELWSVMLDQAESKQVGVRASTAKFFFAQILNGVEYLHKNGIVHRDLKPENIMVRPNGQLFIIDFGTAKNLINPRLNGPEFVGTAEYMSPEAVGNKMPLNTNADLWALGAILYQMLCGPVAFKGASEYYTFLMVQYGQPLAIPAGVDEEGADLVRKLLRREPGERIGANGNMQQVKEHPFFARTHDVGGQPVDFERLTERPSAPLPTLTELYVEGVAKAALDGMRPALHKLSSAVQGKVKHFLRQRGRLCSPEIVRLFYMSRADATFHRAEGRDVLGYSHAEERLWKDPFFFVYVAHPRVGASDGASAKRLAQLVRAANAMRPRPTFFLCCGDLTEHSCEGDAAVYEQEVQGYRRIMCGLAPSITVVSVGSEQNYGKAPLKVEHLVRYREHFGSDYFHFWKGGASFIVINSALLSMVPPADLTDTESGELTPELLATSAAASSAAPVDHDRSGIEIECQNQLRWLRDSFFRARTCSKQTCLFSTHSVLSSKKMGEEEGGTMFGAPHANWLLNKMEWCYVKYGFSPHNSRNSRAISTASTESYESGDVHCTTTASTDGMRVVRLFEGNVRTAFHSLGADMVTRIGLDPKEDEQEVVVVPHDEPAGGNLSFTSSKAYDDHLDNLAGLSVSGTGVNPGVASANQGDEDDEDDEGGLVVEDVTGQIQ